MKFTAKDAAQIGRQSLERSYTTYSKFANACRVRLQRFVTEHPEQKFMIYAIPLVLVGGALHDGRETINHVMHELHRDGFRAAYLGENLIYITWATPEDVPKVNDYIAQATTPRPVVSREHGPGRAQRTRQTASYRSYLNDSVRQRQQEYVETNIETRSLYSGASTHEEAMRNLIHSHNRL